MIDVPGINFEEECKRLYDKLNEQECKRVAERGKLQRDIDLRDKEIDILKAKLSIIELIFGK